MGDRRVVGGGPTRRTVLLALGACAVAPAPSAQRWLLGAQGPDGAWRSTRYGLMADGAVPTALATYALLRAGERGPAVAAGLDFLRRSAVQGGLGLGPVQDWPTYATSLWILAEATATRPGWREVVAPALTFVRRQQLLGPAYTGHPAEGGFGMGLLEPPPPPWAGHVDLSMTRFAVSALRAAGAPPSDPAVQGALRYARAAAAGPGFVYGTDPGTTKSASPDTPYGSATADGLLVLLAGDARDGAAAHAWLVDHFAPDHNPGVAWPGYDVAMAYYWRAAVAEVFARLGGPPGWRASLRAALEAAAHPDGAHANPEAAQKEDEPIVATALALLTESWASQRP